MIPRLWQWCRDKPQTACLLALVILLLVAQTTGVLVFGVHVAKLENENHELRQQLNDLRKSQSQ
jgi:hypothetical protein